VAHFQLSPEGGIFDYFADNALAPGSLARVSFPPGYSVEIALWGGAGLSVRSTNDSVVKNPLNERLSADRQLRIFTLSSQTPGYAQIEFGVGEHVDEDTRQWVWPQGGPVAGVGGSRSGPPSQCTCWGNRTDWS